MGERKDTAELLRLIDVSVLCSFREGFSNVILESMASGNPMVASNVGGNPEAIVEGQTGLLFDPRRPEDLAAKIMALLSNKDLLQYMRVESRKRAEALFSTTKMIDMYDKLYVRLLESKRAAYLLRVDLEGRANALSSSESNHETK